MNLSQSFSFSPPKNLPRTNPLVLGFSGNNSLFRETPMLSLPASVRSVKKPNRNYKELWGRQAYTSFTIPTSSSPPTARTQLEILPRYLKFQSSNGVCGCAMNTVALHSNRRIPAFSLRPQAKEKSSAEQSCRSHSRLTSPRSPSEDGNRNRALEMATASIVLHLSTRHFSAHEICLKSVEWQAVQGPVS